MSAASAVDGVLVQWGDRLFYPGNRLVKVTPAPRLGGSVRSQAAAIRRRIEATVTRRSPQVIVRVTGGGRGMGAIAAHFRYISKNGQLEFEDDRGVVNQGREALHDLLEQWRLGGSLIGQTSPRREAINLVLAMPQGTDAQIVLQATREFAQIELKEHRYVMVLHEHQHSPHVHLCVRGESIVGKRLHPCKADLHRWRETFRERLVGLGVDAEATRQATRGEGLHSDKLWQFRARQQGGPGNVAVQRKSGDAYQRNRVGALEAWAHIVAALRASDQAEDRELAQRIGQFIQESTFAKEHGLARDRALTRGAGSRDVEPAMSRGGREPDMQR